MGRIILKVSGEALGSGEGCYNTKMLNRLTDELIEIHELGIEVGIVLGGGNIFRGLQGENIGIESVVGDYVGMLATIQNALILSEVLLSKKVPITGIHLPSDE